ncbi:hypothetical protein EDB85DRAFT_1893260 [Lactarius pseudohatsudake]|nr:hypothetical protein EDB85DRAFT_1893260 [Lactarius pseudohatsudake]
MASSSWNTSDNLPGPSSIAEALVSSANLGGKYQASYPALFPGYHTLKKCLEKLQEIKALLDGLSEHRRRKIMTASQQGSCISLESLEMELERLSDDYRDLCRLYEQSSMLQRSFLGKQLQTDTAVLEHRIKEFYKDAWKTTTDGKRSINWGAVKRMRHTHADPRCCSPHSCYTSEVAVWTKHSDEAVELSNVHSRDRRIEALTRRVHGNDTSPQDLRCHKRNSSPHPDEPPVGTIAMDPMVDTKNGNPNILGIVDRRHV